MEMYKKISIKVEASKNFEFLTPEELGAFNMEIDGPDYGIYKLYVDGEFLTEGELFDLNKYACTLISKRLK